MASQRQLKPMFSRVLIALMLAPVLSTPMPTKMKAFVQTAFAQKYETDVPVPTIGSLRLRLRALAEKR